ncbi:MAG TPA: FAD-binding oxidoreductase [Burkholderiales bacterium]|nr:FAD-binding oxidoreductase [Burkholderiales bacterium]
MSYDPLTARTPGTGLDYAPSYWAATAGDVPPDDGALAGSHDVEVAIIGGGYTGLSCAYHLARERGIRATVLEANKPGWGCSGRNGGFARAAIGRHSWGKVIEKFGRDAARAVFGEALAAVDNVRAMIDQGDIACDALEAGHLKIAHRASRAPGLKREAELLQREFEYPAEFVEADELRERHFAGPEAHGALRFPDAVAVHPLKLALGVLRMARDAGAKVHSASPVISWTREGATHVLATPNGSVRAKTVVVATNGYTPEHLHPALRGTTLPVLSHIVVTRPMTREEKQQGGFVTSHVLTDTRNLLYYWRRLPDDRILFGGRGKIVETTDGQAAQREALLDGLKQKVPALRDITADYDWWGWVCLTPDFLPHVSRAADDASVHYAIGYQGSGVSYALYAGKRLAAAIAHEPMSTLPVSGELPRFPLASFRRLGQRLAYQWYRYADNRD